ncbi:fibrinogen C domain-containing protein 1-like isoform X1 [Porites lutea]|uniref:fibrinogen C domain-containing protein 1-like isoform X1 n=1 Tax=Porites lutea TaxID=51062 RepID=UPI003CC60D88
MACSRSFLSLIYTLSVLVTLGPAYCKVSNASQGTQVKDSAPNVYNTYNTFCTGLSKKIEVLLHDVKNELSEMREEIRSLKENNTTSQGYRNCAELYKAGQRKSGVYTINPDNAGAFDVYCDQTTAGGGWTVLQKRLDGSVDFYRGWDDYKRGFGNLNGEFWLGLDKIHRLTILRSRLRVDLEDTNGKTAYAEYDFFGVSSERSKYKLSLGTYSGTAGDSLGRHRGYGFTTKDRDNDSWNQNCASRFKGAWWYSDCIISSLNGVYLHGKHSKSWEGMVWVSWKGANYSVKRAEMKIRPVKA